MWQNQPRQVQNAPSMTSGGINVINGFYGYILTSDVLHFENVFSFHWKRSKKTNSTSIDGANYTNTQ